MFHNFKDGMKKHRHPLDRLTEATALLSGVGFYPQLFKLYTTRQAADLAPTTFLIFTISNAIWIAYGIHRRALPILISSSLNLIASACILVMILLFQSR